MHSRSYLRALRARDDVHEVLLLDESRPALASEVGSQLGIETVMTAAELLDCVDAVIITSANADHRRMTIEAAQAGVHVLAEKPLATSVADAEAMIAGCNAGVILATAFPCPFSPAFRALCERYSQGELGRLLAIRATNRGSMPGGFFIELDRSGGGAVIDHTVHVADLCGASPGRIR